MAGLLQDRVVNRGGFSSAAAQMSALVDGIHGGGTGHIDDQVSKVFLGRGRHLVPLTARSLAEDETFNNAAFASKMSKTDKTWKCSNCPTFSSTLKIVAKRHARLCGERPKWPKKRSVVARLKCSACPEKFQTKKSLQNHYRLEHADRRRSYKCTICQKDLGLWKNLRRHMEEKHGESAWQCNVCDKQFSRIDNLKRHFKSKHCNTRFLSPLVESMQAKIDDLLNRQIASPLSIMEAARLRNLCAQRDILMREEEAEKSQGDPHEGYALQFVRGKKRPATVTAGGIY